MEMRMKTLLPVLAVIAAVSFSSGASAQPSGTADQAKALLAKAAAAVKADEAGALARFDDAASRTATSTCSVSTASPASCLPAHRR